MSSPGGYDPKQFESEIYAAWEAAGHFHAEPDSSRQPFVITIPPPNVTGALHLGHALNNTLQDILIRRKRMQGFNACWLPGTDHAGIATQAVVEKRLREEQGWKRDSSNPEHRKFLVEKIWEWKEEYNTRILKQLRRMGCSCDWPRTRFTLDEQCAKAVYETFFRFFKDGLIYRGLRLVNWDTQLQTAVADDEVYHETVRGSLWHIRYPIAEGIEGLRDSGIKGSDGLAGRESLNPSIPQSLNPCLVVATTRPETMLADTAVAVHPDDERYKHLIGKHVLLPLMNRPIPIVADGMLVKREFGTGCVKVTPGHDPNDYACWQRKQGQPDQIDVRDLLTPDGRIRPDYGPYSGMKKDEARKKVVADLEALGLLEKVEPYETEVGHSDRSKTPIEPLRSEQWFVKMDKPSGPRLAESAMEAVRDGRVQFFPQRYAKTYLDWLGEKRDWCISRQLWWGHRIPVWSKRMTFADWLSWGEREPDAFCLDGLNAVGYAVFVVDSAGNQLSPADWLAGPLRASAQRGHAEGWSAIEGELTWHVSVKDLDARTYDYTKRPLLPWIEQNGFIQDPDVLDTWFSSALWPHSTFGWPDNPNPPREWGASTAPAEEPTTGVVGSDLGYFYPTSVLSTAREIITLWVARMVMTGLYNIGRVPFQHVYIHAVIQDGQGRRMSKSAGNGVDPLDIVDAYGADALRFTLAQLATETQDIRIPVKPAQLPDGRTVNTSERFELGRNLVTKLWQAATGFLIPTCKDVRIERGENDWHTDPEKAPLFEKWIRVKLSACIRELDQRLDSYEFSAAVETIRTFFWNDVCDWYIEEVKSHLRDAAAGDAEKNYVKITLLQTFDIVLCLFHPAIPFVTEAIWCEIGREIPRHHELIWPEDSELPSVAPMLIATPWPKPASDAGMTTLDVGWLDAVKQQTAAEREVDTFLAVIRALREIRTSLNAIRSQAKQPALRNLPAAVVRCNSATAALLARGEATILRLGQVETGGLTISPDAPKPPQSMSRVLSVAGSSVAAQTIEIYVPIAGLADLDIERKRLAKDRDESAAALQRLEAKLANEGFISKAKPEVIETERARLVELKEKLAAIERNLAELG